jgi:hypothetical protein
MENLKKFTFINCICCGNKISMFDAGRTLTREGGTEEYFKNVDMSKYKPESQMWNGGVVGKMSAPYGSCHDGDIFYLGICDTCVDEGYKNGRLRYQGNYISQSHRTYLHKFTDEELEEQEKKRNRENNLNDLIN